MNLPTESESELQLTSTGQPRLRGFMIRETLSSSSTPEERSDDLRRGDLIRDLTRDLTELKKWGANVVRYPLRYIDANDANNAVAIIEYQIDVLEKALAKINWPELKVIIDIHNPPGGDPIQNGRLPVHPILDESDSKHGQYQTTLEDTWKRIADRLEKSAYKSSIYGYDLLNEPNGSAEAWRELAIKLGKAVQSEHPEARIIIESPYGHPHRLKDLKPFSSDELDNVVYSVHVYDPIRFTHQGISDKDGKRNEFPVSFPSDSRILSQLQFVIDYQKTYKEKYDIPIYIGEFSAVRWASTGNRYLRRVIKIFERNGWDWTYHAFREAQSWDPELKLNEDFDDDKSPVDDLKKSDAIMAYEDRVSQIRNDPDKYTTRREKLLKAALLKNAGLENAETSLDLRIFTDVDDELIGLDEEGVDDLTGLLAEDVLVSDAGTPLESDSIQYIQPDYQTPTTGSSFSEGEKTHSVQDVLLEESTGLAERSGMTTSLYGQQNLLSEKENPLFPSITQIASQ
jgi:hypothetical protein